MSRLQTKDSEDEDEEEEFVPSELLETASLPPIELECSLNSFLIRVCYIDSPSNFYVYLEEKLHYLKMFLQNLDDFYQDNEKFKPNVDTLPKNSYWCVNILGQWMRAKIISNIGRLKPNLKANPVPYYKVFLVDKGCMDVVSLDNLRYLNEQFMFEAPFAIPCSLSDVYPLTTLDEENTWPIETNQVFEEMCSSEVLIATFWSKTLSSHYDVILEALPRNDSMPTINEILVLEGFATSVMLKSDFEATLQEMRDSKFEPEITQEGSKNEVKCNEEIESNFENDIIHDETLEVAQQNIFDRWDPLGMDHVVKESLQDDNDPERYFLGYKNEDAKKICSYTRYGQTCQRGPTCKWSHIQPRDDGLPSGEDEAIAYLKCPQISLEEGGVYRAMVLSSTSPSLFYTLFEIDDISGASILSEIKDELSEIYKNNITTPAPYTPALGELMVLCQNDGPMAGYYRVRVIELSQRQLGVLVKVFYIDYGLEEWVKECNLRIMLECFLYNPAQAVECHLFDVIPNDNNTWEPEALEFFNEIFHDKFATVTVLNSLSSDRYGIELEFSDEVQVINVNSTIVDRGLAKFT